MIKAVAAIVAVMVSVAASDAGTDWVIVTSASNDGGAIGAFLVDKGSIKDGDDGKQADVMLVAANQYADYLMVLDCKGRRWRYTAAKVVKGDAKPSFETGDDWDDANPGTPMNSVLDYACSNGTTPAPVGKDLGAGDPVAATRAWIASGAKL